MNVPELSKKQSKVLLKTNKFLRFARDSIDHDITAQRLIILITVCLHEGKSQNELLELLDKTSVTALSRNLADLSSLTSRKMEGPGLVELRNDPLNLRKKRVYLTDAGRRYLFNWLESMN